MPVLVPAQPAQAAPPLPTFWLGVHRPHWLKESRVPMFVSNRQLARVKTLPRAGHPWALDSGFTEITKFGEWRTTPQQYVQQIRRYRDEVGRLSWASQQDLMCEDDALRMTGLTIDQHQDLTVANFLTLRELAPSFRSSPSSRVASSPLRPVRRKVRGGRRRSDQGAPRRRGQHLPAAQHLHGELDPGGLARHGLEVARLRLSSTQPTVVEPTPHRLSLRGLALRSVQVIAVLDRDEVGLLSQLF